MEAIPGAAVFLDNRLKKTAMENHGRLENCLLGVYASGVMVTLSPLFLCPYSSC